MQVPTMGKVYVNEGYALTGVLVRYKYKTSMPQDENDFFFVKCVIVCT